MNWKRHLVEDVIKKMLPELTHKNFKQMSHDVVIDVRFEKILNGIQGFVMQTDDHEYEIILNRNQTREELIVNMCHELVHVCQEECGYEFDYDLPYFEQPHEIEAYEMQEMLAKKYTELTS